MSPGRISEKSRVATRRCKFAPSKGWNANFRVLLQSFRHQLCCFGGGGVRREEAIPLTVARTSLFEHGNLELGPARRKISSWGLELSHRDGERTWYSNWAAEDDKHSYNLLRRALGFLDQGKINVLLFGRDNEAFAYEIAVIEKSPKPIDLIIKAIFYKKKCSDKERRKVLEQLRK